MASGEWILLSFKLQSWNAIAPGLESEPQWKAWAENPVALPAELHGVSLKQIPPMLRRRFTELGRASASSALPLLEGIDAIPGVFASRHGDTPLTFSLLEGIARNEPMSPTGFSLAVHNAVAGLLSIARKDLSEVTAIAATRNLIVSALLEAVTQLQERDQVLCVIYDVPLPELYRSYSSSETHPYALAMLLSRTEGEDLTLSATHDGTPESDTTSELIRMMRFLLALDEQAHFATGAGSGWRLGKPVTAQER
ncbi:beta-ketoacyl synthase chain length factor [Pokkaliibacter sp. CJK22405]|uniref:beta-ketoacyl synthase chain length factor n=1 Tax=Pokkaliibacter sp. CJK22405 TaxID=3384615 RepID=UPI00398503F7